MQMGIASLRFLLACFVLSGCGGVHSDIVFRPLAPAGPTGVQPLGREIQAYLEIELEDVDLRISGVRVSSKLEWIVGPAFIFPAFWEDPIPVEGHLRIGLRVRVKEGASVEFDPRQITVAFEDGRSLTPNGTFAWLPNSELEPVEFATLSAGQTWQRSLQFDVLVSELIPFALRLGTLIVNGEEVEIPPVSYVRDDSGHSS
jgi:hypothetical protein